MSRWRKSVRPETSIRQGIRAITEKYKRRRRQRPGGIAGAYFGYGTDAGGMTTGGYQKRFRQNYNNYQISRPRRRWTCRRSRSGRPPGAPATRPTGRC
jgi:hypothetical protein